MSDDDDKMSSVSSLGSIDEDLDDQGINDEEEEEPVVNDKRKKPSGTKQKPRKVAKTRKRQKRNISDFYELDVEESEGSETSDREVDGAEGEMTNLEQERLFKEHLKKKEAQVPGFMRIEEDKLHDYFEHFEEEHQDFDDEQEEITKQGMLPTLRDPKCFQVRCKLGSEREAAFEVLMRYIAYLGTSQEFRLVSASAVDKIKGYIYLEAYNMEDATVAIDNNSYISGKNIKRVDLASVPQVFEPDLTKNIDIKPQQFVRIKTGKGLYEGDLARVWEVDENKRMVTCQLVPRVAMNQEEDDVDDGGEGEPDESEQRKMRFQKAKIRQQKKLRPPQRIFDANEFTQEIEKRRVTGTQQQFFVYKGQFFYDGLAHKKFPITSLQLTNVAPTYDEVQTFGKALGNTEEMYSSLLEKAGFDRANKFKVGDKVRVITGQYNGLTGTVKQVTPSVVTMITPQIEDPLDFAPSELAKNFNKGDYIRVIAGKNVGKVGFISTIDDNNATITSDDLLSQFTSFVNDLVLASDTARVQKADNRSNEYKKFDLVRLNDTKTFGAVISLDDFSMRIIDNNGRVQTVRFADIDFVVDTRRYLAKNDFNQEFHFDDTVKVLDGTYKGRIGAIKHIYRGLVFLFNVELTQTSGLFVEKVNNCYLISSKYDQRNMVSSGQEQGGRKGKRDPLLGALCCIIKGAWKGYQGLVREANEKHVTIEITSKCMKKTIARELVRPLSEINDDEYNYNSGTLDPKTPMPHAGGFNPTSPWIGGAGGLGASPAWGAGGFETPAYDQSFR